MPRIRVVSVPTQGKCPLCGGVMVLRCGKLGHFFGCSSYPQCQHLVEAPEHDPDDGEMRGRQAAQRMGIAGRGFLDAPYDERDLGDSWFCEPGGIFGDR